MSEPVYMCDVLFPEYREGDDAVKYLKQSNDYLFLLREYLGYALDNLGIANFNVAQLETLTKNIQDPLNIKLEEADEAITRVSITTDGLSASIDRLNESQTKLEATAAGLSATVSNVEGDMSAVKVTVAGLETRVGNAEGSISTLSQTADSLSSRVSTTEGDVSTLEQTAKSLSSQMTAVDGRMSTVEQTADDLSTRVGTTEGDISTLEQTASSLSGRISTTEGDITSLEATTSGLQTSVTKAQSAAESASTKADEAKTAASTAVQTAEEVSTTVTTQLGNYVSRTGATQTAEGFAFTIGGNDGTSYSDAKLTFTRAGLTAEYRDGTTSTYKSGVTIDKDGLTVSNGKIKIKNTAGSEVFAADENGNIEMTGTINGSNMYGSSIYGSLFSTQDSPNDTSGGYIRITDGTLRSFYNGALSGPALISGRSQYDYGALNFYREGDNVANMYLTGNGNDTYNLVVTSSANMEFSASGYVNIAGRWRTNISSAGSLAFYIGANQSIYVNDTTIASTDASGTLFWYI